MRIDSRNQNVNDDTVRIVYLDCKTSSYSKYEDFVLGYICIIRKMRGISRYIQRDHDMNTVLRADKYDDKYTTNIDKCYMCYRIASIRLKHPILTVDNYVKIDDLL